MLQEELQLFFLEDLKLFCVARGLHKSTINKCHLEWQSLPKSIHIHNLTTTQRTIIKEK